MQPYQTFLVFLSLHSLLRVLANLFGQRRPRYTSALLGGVGTVPLGLQLQESIALVVQLLLAPAILLSQNPKLLDEFFVVVSLVRLDENDVAPRPRVFRERSDPRASGLQRHLDCPELRRLRLRKTFGSCVPVRRRELLQCTLQVADLI